MTDSRPTFARTESVLDSGLSGLSTLSYSVVGAEPSVMEYDRLSAPPIASDRVNILGVGAMPLDLGKAVATLERWRVERRRDYVCVVSVHGLVTAQRNPEIRKALNRSGMATEDGMPLVCGRAWQASRRRAAFAAQTCSRKSAHTACRAGTAITFTAPARTCWSC